MADPFFDTLWRKYTQLTPQAERIRGSLIAMGETVVNDHVAFRTIARGSLSLEHLETHILELGYQRLEPYDFPAKKLSAFGYIGPNEDSPRIFLSELRVDELSKAAGRILDRCADAVSPEQVAARDVLVAGRLWPPIPWQDYQTLRDESEYAAWIATLGICPNHFTISINSLRQFTEVEPLLRHVESLGFAINASGGRVKGSAAQLLQQGSTLADQMPVQFAGNETHRVPTCYYEFAKRYRDSDGNVFQGFVARSADKIFESTHTPDKPQRTDS